MLEKLFSPSVDTRSILPELDPATVQRIVEGNIVKRLICEAQNASNKCSYYAGQCLDQDIAKLFEVEAKLIDRSAKSLEVYFENMTREVRR